ncbi:MAG: peptidase T, partial [Salibacteraceae bacterium]|nr:peptidase T [Salibacteraceae bacterium]
MNYSFTVVDRFLNYVKIDTQSDPHSASTPSTEKQMDLSRLLVKELQAMGVEDAEMDEHGYVYATLKSNSEKQVPVICFCSHVDTSPETTGQNVNPIIHKNYDGGIIKYAKDSSLKLDPAEHPELAKKLGNDIITTDGTTLLGADNKAGVAEIMDMAHYFISNPEVRHGDIRILFTPDEEIGRGADKVNIKKLGADFGYTVDGEALGSFEDETFSADMVQITIHGVNAHPGFAKGNMENALKAASKFIDLLPQSTWSPETTAGREGFVHPYEMKGGVEKMELTFIIRSFVDADLKTYEHQLEELLKSALENYPNMTYEFNVSEQYRNMKNIISQHSAISTYAIQA